MSKELTVLNTDETELMVLDEGEEGGTGLENMTAEDNIVPRLQIAAGTSKQVMKGHDKYIKGLSQGDIFNTVTGKIYGESVKVVPVWYSKNRILFDKEFKIECSSPDGISGGTISPDSCESCEFSKWGTGKNDKGFACTEFRNFAVLVFDENGVPELASVSMKSTSTGTAKKWLNMIEARKVKTAKGDIVQMPMEYGYYTLNASAKEGDAGAFYAWGVNNAGSIPSKTEEDKKLRAFTRKTHKSFKDAEVKITGTAEVADA